METAIVRCASLPDVTWLDSSTCSFTDDLAVFRFQLPKHRRFANHLRSLLHTDEQTRAERYYRDEDRQRFMYTRAILRILAGYYTNQHPDRIRILAGLNNKPELDGNTGWHINVSHSGSWVLIALGRVNLGIDVEKISPDFPFHDVLMPSFSPDEQQRIETSSEARLAFYQLWTRKEALLKATAKGIHDDLPRIPSLDGTHYVESNQLGGTGNWLVTGFMVTDTYPAALAYHLVSKIPKFYTLDSGLLDHYES
jgi:4'-phosphopantetheinyl transferase